jgi:hypothetical protein
VLAQSRFPVPLLLVYVTARKIDNDQNSVVIIFGLADRRRTLADGFSGPPYRREGSLVAA